MGKYLDALIQEKTLKRASREAIKPIKPFKRSKIGFIASDPKRFQEKNNIIENSFSEPKTALLSPVKKMELCLHGRPCFHLELKSDRQVCEKNGQHIFDMDRCPDDLWETPEPYKEDYRNMPDYFKPDHCRCCGCTEFWSLGKGEKLICARCHPPQANLKKRKQ